MIEEQNEAVSSVQSELLFIGCLWKSPDVYIQFSKSVQSDYDFTDKCCKFLYCEFENYYLTFSQTVTENKVNTYMSEQPERFKTYRKYDGWKTIKDMMELADVADVKNVFQTLKKYSLIREYAAKGFPAEKILEFKGFQQLTANDIYRLMRAKVDKINVQLNNLNEPVILTDNTTKLITSFLDSPEFGIPSCFQGFNNYTRGYLRSKTYFNGFLSNEGKSRFMTKIICDIALKQRQPVMLLSNEQTEQDFHNCMITTIVNNPEFQELHGIKIHKPEKEIVMGLYRSDKTQEFIYRKTDSNGDFLETQEEYINRVNSESSEFREIMKISKWIDEQTKNKLIYFLDVSEDYSDNALETEIKKAKLCYNCNYIFYDTLKAWQLESWDRVKLTCTKLCEIAKQNNLYMMFSFQMTDGSVFDSVFDLTSNNIASCKGIKTVADILTLGKKILPEEYNKYQYIPFDDDTDELWGEVTEIDLNPDKKYFAQILDKNRLAERGKVLLYEYDLNENTWKNVGLLVKKRT